MAIIPYGGTVGIVMTTLLVALQDVWLGLRVLVAGEIVLQILENLVAPRILGSFTGLNPFWVLISLLAGAQVGGLLGVVVAVPIAVVIKVALESVRSRDIVTETTPVEGADPLVAGQNPRRGRLSGGEGPTAESSANPGVSL